MYHKSNRDYNELYRQARSIVLKRDKKKCQMPNCNSRKKIQVHHITRWADNIAWRYEVTNLICLCTKCHNSIKNKEHFYASLFREIVAKNARYNGNT